MTDTTPPNTPDGDGHGRPPSGSGGQEPPRYGQRLPGYEAGSPPPGTPTGGSPYQPHQGAGGYGPGQGPQPEYGQSAPPPYGGQPGWPYPAQQPYGGQSAGPPVGSYGYQQPQGRGMAIATLVLGLVALVTFCVPILPLVLGLVALGVGFAAIRRIRQGRETGRGMAITGMVTGGIGLVAGSLLMILFMSLLPVLPEILSDIDKECSSLPASQQQECIQRVVEDWQARR